MEKLHAACDDCRIRKLKCSGEKPVCARCARELVQCYYSPQKQMGRPRKRRRDDEADQPTEPSVEASLQAMNEMIGFPDFDLVSPPELHDQTSTNGSTGNAPSTPAQYDLGFLDNVEGLPVSNLGLTSDSLVDPSLWTAQAAPSQLAPNHDTPASSSNLGPCPCLSLMYLTLTDLQLVPTFSFPQVIIPLRKALAALSTLIQCPRCPKEAFSAIQNIHSITALFKAVVERFNKVLQEVDAEATRLQQQGQKKPYRVGDNNPALFHLHTGTPDCPMGFNIELEAGDWKRLVKTALRAEVYGRGDGGGSGGGTKALVELIAEVEARQATWHTHSGFVNDGTESLFGGGKHECRDGGTCRTLGADQLRRAIDGLSWD